MRRVFFSFGLVASAPVRSNKRHIKMLNLNPRVDFPSKSVIAFDITRLIKIGTILLLELFGEIAPEWWGSESEEDDNKE